MHVQIITSHLTDMTEEGHREACGQLAPAHTDVVDVASRAFTVHEDLTRLTRPGLTLLAEVAA